MLKTADNTFNTIDQPKYFYKAIRNAASVGKFFHVGSMECLIICKGNGFFCSFAS